MAEAPRVSSVLGKLANGTQYDPNDIYIAVMGVTGSGKSTFISKLVGEGKIEIGHGLVSCTSEVDIETFLYNGRKIHLIDTPGFDDTRRTDTDILRDIVFWLNHAYKLRVRLSGIVFLHPINHTRMTGPQRKNMSIFQKLCGPHILPSVVLATTMWDEVREEVGERRMEELKTTKEFWGEMVGQGSRVFRHDDTRASAINIITYILDLGRTTVLQIQHEMVEQGLQLDQTPAGQELMKELIKEREIFNWKLLEAQRETQEAIAEGDRKAAIEGAERQERFMKKLREAQEGTQRLQVDMENLIKEKDAEFQKTIRQLERENRRAAGDVRRTKEDMGKMQEMIRLQKNDADENQRRHEREMEQMSRQFEEYKLQHQTVIYGMKMKQERREEQDRERRRRERRRRERDREREKEKESTSRQLVMVQDTQSDGSSFISGVEKGAGLSGLSTEEKIGTAIGAGGTVVAAALLGGACSVM